jgi:hypothetical protein
VFDEIDIVNGGVRYSIKMGLIRIDVCVGNNCNSRKYTKKQCNVRKGKESAHFTVLKQI